MTNRMLTADQVKSYFNIPDFRSLSKERLIEFVSVIPYIDKDVAIKIIEQFPAPKTSPFPRHVRSFTSKGTIPCPFGMPKRHRFLTGPSHIAPEGDGYRALREYI